MDSVPLTTSLCTKPSKVGFVLTASGKDFLVLPSEKVMVGSMILSLIILA